MSSRVLLALAALAAIWWATQPRARARAPGAPPLIYTPEERERMTTEYTDPPTRWTTPPAGAKYEPLFLAASAAHNLPPGLLSRVADQESDYNPDARSPVGALGIMQIVPYWHPGVDPFDPDQAIPYAAKYLRQNYDRFGSWAKALAAYNWGPTALARNLRDGEANWLARAPLETQDYVREVIADTGVV